MRIISRKSLNLRQRQEILELWNEEYPVNLKYGNLSEFEDYLSKLEDQQHFLLLDENKKIRGWYFDFLRGNERWFAVILDSGIQGQHFGTRLMELATSENSELNGWAIVADDYLRTNGQLYKSPVGFYKKMGFEILEDERLETDRMSAIKIKWYKKP